MSSKKDIKNYISALEKRFKKELPRVSEEIQVYENKLSQGKLNKNPAPAPQFSESAKITDSRWL